MGRSKTEQLEIERRKKISINNARFWLGKVGANKGKKFSEEHRRKISESQKGKKIPEEVRKKISEALKGRKLPPEVRKKISESNKGRKFSEETRRKISEALRGGKSAWLGKTLPDEVRRKMSKAHKGEKNHFWGKKHTEETRRKISEAKKGKRQSLESRIKIANANRGANNYQWKGGITPLVLKIRHSFKYRQWRSDVFTRDNFTCQNCGQRGGVLNAHHIKKFIKIMDEYKIRSLEDAFNCEELWNINNGITLCKDCHKKIPAREKETQEWIESDPYFWENLT